MDFCAWPDTMMRVAFVSDIPQNKSIYLYCIHSYFFLGNKVCNPKFRRPHMCFRHMGKNKKLRAPSCYVTWADDNIDMIFDRLEIM